VNSAYERLSRRGLGTTAEFDRAARKIDIQSLRRVKAYLSEVLERDDPRARGRALSANLAGYWRYRIGDYRVVVEFRDDVFVIVAIGLGHGSEICRTGPG
jgi:mRNA interferase RelE/StbE